MDDFLALGRKILASQPFSKLVGAELTEFSPGHAELVIPITHQLKQQHGFVHGGVISYAADNTLTFAGGSALGTDVVTAEYKINYLRPAVGKKLIARAEVVYSSKTQAVCRCNVYVTRDGEEVLCAAAQGTIAKISRTPKDKT